jgi:hypothetical protein
VEDLCKDDMVKEALVEKLTAHKIVFELSEAAEGSQYQQSTLGDGKNDWVQRFSFYNKMEFYTSDVRQKTFGATLTTWAKTLKSNSKY